MNAAEEEEWRKAQGISISADLDLITAAKQQLLFLASVDRCRCLYDGPALQRAIYRYEQCWLPLLAEHTLWDNAKFRLVVPLDCEWIWHCHRLNPVQYGKDCNKIYGRILDASFVESSTREADRKETEMIWKYFYPEEPYELDLSHSVSAKSAGIIFRSMLKIQYDLTEAVWRQSSFFYQVSRPHMFDDRFLKGAEERYKGFLYLIKKNRNNSVNCFCVPTYDIDLMWHSHQLQPIAYTRDMLNLLGKMLDHNDMDSDRSKGKKLDVGFTETKIQWESTFGRRYWRAGAMHRGDAPPLVPLAPFLSENCDREDTRDEDSDCLHEPLFHFNKDRYHTDQTPVKTVEVLLEVVGIKNIPNDHRDLMFVRFYRDNCPGMEAKKVQINFEFRSKPIAYFQCTATGNFIFELRSRSSPTAKKASKVVGQASIPMQTLLDSTTLSIENWFPLSRNEQWPVGSEPMSLHIAVSITPSTSSYLLWSVRSHSSERKFQLLERSLGIKRVKTVKRYFDHDDKEIFTVKTRKTAKPYTDSIVRSGEVSLQGLPDKRRIVTVYQRNPNSKPSRSYAGETAATAEEMATIGGTAEWALMNHSCNLLIRNLNTIINEEPIFELRGNLGSPLRLFSGRKLQYELPFANPDIEHEFVTLIRYTPKAPFGQATAIFNWNSGVVEVTEQESVLLVALLAEVISVSLTKHQKRLKYSSALDTEANNKVFPTGREASDGTRVNGSDQLIRSRNNRRRGSYGNRRLGGRSGAKANADDETKPTKAEMTLLLGLTAATLATNPAGNCGCGCVSAFGTNCGA